jgi:pilus assembly protein Flp/PilA
MLKTILAWPANCAKYLSGKLFGKDDVGASLVEYALLLALIAVVAIGALFALGGTVSNKLNQVNDCISNSNATCVTTTSTP